MAPSVRRRQVKCSWWISWGSSSIQENESDQDGAAREASRIEEGKSDTNCEHGGSSLLGKKNKI